MKEKIINLLNSENATLRINQYCTLHRWKKDVFGDSVDALEVVFHITNSFHSIAKIESRNWRKIVEEVADAQERAFVLAAEEYNKQLRNGYIG